MHRFQPGQQLGPLMMQAIGRCVQTLEDAGDEQRSTPSRSLTTCSGTRPSADWLPRLKRSFRRAASSAEFAGTGSRGWNGSGGIMLNVPRRNFDTEVATIARRDG